jgi:sigma-E factor negative regulatory protein RseC
MSRHNADHWITEKATVLSCEPDALWVAADKTSACGSCKAKSGCGTSLLAKLGIEQIAVRATLPPALIYEHFVEGEWVELAIDRHAFVKVALLMYLLPLAGLLMGVLLLQGADDWQVALAACVGLFFGGFLTCVLLKHWRNAESLQPVVLRRCLLEGVESVTFQPSSTQVANR